MSHILLPMRLDEKARENLEAAERLLPDEAGRDGLFNAAASRMYYAAYLTVADRALQQGMSFTGRATSVTTDFPGTPSHGASSMRTTPRS